MLTIFPEARRFREDMFGLDRPHTQEDAIYSFLPHTLRKRTELLDLVDYTEQTLHFDHPSYPATR